MEALPLLLAILIFAVGFSAPWLLIVIVLCILTLWGILWSHWMLQRLSHKRRAERLMELRRRMGY